jgi:hypothetical protein
MMLWNILRTSDYPLAILVRTQLPLFSVLPHLLWQAESVSLAGNVSLLSPAAVLSACYPHFMGHLKATISSDVHHVGLEAIQFSKLKVPRLPSSPPHDLL